MEDLNRFLRTHRVLSTERRLVETAQGAYWMFCVEYLESALPSSERTPGKVDYREVLPPEQFAKFSRLRAIRKEIADREAFPPYAVFTNEQLAAMARLDAASAVALQAIDGVGEAKMAKYGARFLEGLTADAKEGVKA
jgi:superfamily II DNA helicase RecQ